MKRKVEIGKHSGIPIITDTLESNPHRPSVIKMCPGSLTPSQGNIWIQKRQDGYYFMGWCAKCGDNREVETKNEFTDTRDQSKFILVWHRAKYYIR